MRADNSRHLVAAARRRSQASRAVAALRRMDRAGTAVTFDSVAREAAVSRAWLYNQPELRTEIERLRQRRRPAAHHRRAIWPSRQRFTLVEWSRQISIIDSTVIWSRAGVQGCDLRCCVVDSVVDAGVSGR